ncbi:rhodanese-like domain-containing protein [uncultured Eudoraea sp.]|uniref:rhodanese-like domain-containing protein n=1 Tax=uncultured Eudoraea sp. TaxID=1035614 RepID=UPI00260BE853|nr:rhodanese-like domain-containing protein [uncultured Eudoraea sp.]
MRYFIKFLCSLFLVMTANAQSSIDQALKWYNRESVPYISVADMQNLSNHVILDARELEEFKVSHLKNAVWIGYDDFKLENVVKNYSDKNLNFIVYCSIGVRSENIGEKLLEAGYLNTRNLYGGIFEWTNQGYPVYNAQGKETKKVHAYGKLWGKYLTKAEKVYQD